MLTTILTTEYALRTAPRLPSGSASALPADRLHFGLASQPTQLDWMVAYGQGAQLGAGSARGLPDTAINILVAAKTDRQDFAGHF